MSERAQPVEHGLAFFEIDFEALSTRGGSPDVPRWMTSVAFMAQYSGVGARFVLRYNCPPDNAIT